jgi:DUF917 family protein
MPQISGPNLHEKQIIETCKEEGCAVSTQETAALRKWERTIDVSSASLVQRGKIKKKKRTWARERTVPSVESLEWEVSADDFPFDSIRKGRV